MTQRFVSDTLDLSRLPAPQVIKGVDYESIRAASLVDLVARMKAAGIELDTANLETEPAAILAEAAAYREMLARAAINDAARAVMVAFATGSDLDHLAAFYGVARLVITPATDQGAAVMESDADLRERVQLAPEALPYAGMTGGGYRALARRTAPTVKDVATIKRPGGVVDVVLLSREGSGATPPAVVDAVYRAFQDDEATQLTDVVTVRPATIVPYSVNLTLLVRRGPDPAIVKAAAEAGVRKYAASRHKVGQVVYADMIVAAAAVGGVENATVDISDVDPGVAGAAFLELLVTTVELTA
jgi:phage-related baseplate assembly protein